MPAAKSTYLQIRISQEDKQRVMRAAKAAYLDNSTWARQVILQAVERFEAKQGRRKKSGR